ncbi:MAG: nucleoside triphosphate pyrophosphohydrolase [Deltaproteobacteria bacterium]|nr:nucleoside triphosphate pyrophosphohydrolase [Deltaproteobacteria bacterium]
MPKASTSFEKLIEIMATLRGPGGCPWDKEQSYQDINPYLLEEAHEVAESVDAKDFAGMKEELGDLLVHILFYSQLAAEDKKFTVEDVAQSACEKLIRRHPHVFGDEKVSSTQEVLVNWEKIKQTEKKKESILEGLPKALPALVKAFRLGEKSSRVGFDWKETSGIFEKVKEEMNELSEVIGGKDAEAIEREYGDLLFTLANLGRFLKLDPETTLRKAASRFIERFQFVEKKAKQDNRTLQSLSPQEWDQSWEEAKKKIQD